MGKLRGALRDHAAGVVLAVAAGALLWFVGYPICWLLLGALGLPHAVHLGDLARVFAQPANVTPLLNTVGLAVGAGAASIVLGVPFAWVTARSDVPFRRALHTFVGVAYILPPYLTSLAYIILLGPHAGHLNRLFAWLFRLPHAPINIFSAGGVIFVVSMHVFAFTYFLTHGALQGLDASLEESAQLLGAGHWAVARSITLPLVAPAISGGALLAAVDSMALFGPQAFLGLPAGVVYLPTRIYGALTGYPPRFPEASALSIILVLLTAAGLAVQRRYLARRSFATIGGRGIRSVGASLGLMRWPLLLVCLLLVFFSSVAPLAVLGAAAFSKVWTNPPTIGNLTLANFQAALLTDQIAARGVVNSLKLAAEAATVAVAIGFAVAYLDVRTMVRGRRLLDYLAILPLGLPGTVMAVALLQAFIRPPMRIYGTIWILLVAYVTRFIPLAVRTTHAALQQVDASLEEVARITGAPWLGAVRLILVPLIRPSLLLAWLLVFIPALSELGATILLYTSGTETISVAIFRLNDLGQLEVVAALSLVMVTVILLAALLTQGFAGRGRRPVAMETTTF